MIKRSFKEHTLFIFILSGCIILRLIPLFDYQFTLDELSGLGRTRFNSFGELMDKGVKIDAHPALVQVLIYYLSRAFGYINWVIKLPFLIFSFGAVIYAYLFCLRNFSKQSALIATSVFSFSLVFVFYAPIARMYISGIFFSMALLYYFFEIFFLKNIQRRNYILLGLFALLSALNQHINALFAFTICASGLFLMAKSERKKYLLTLFIVVVAYLPHLPVTLYQLNIGGIGYEQGGWLERPEITAAFDFFKILFGTGRTYLVFIALIVLCFVVNRKFKLDRKQLFLLAIFIINYLVVYIYSITKASIYQNSVMLFSGTALVILISSLLDVKNKYVFYSVFTVVTVLLIFKTYYKKDYYHQCVRTVFEFQYERTLELKKIYGDKNVYPVFFDSDDVMKEFYFKKYGSSFEYKESSDSVTFSIKHFSRFVASLQTDYLVLSSSYPVQDAVAQEYYPYLIENVETQAINYKVFSKKPADKNKVVANDKHYYAATIFNKGDLTFEKIKEVVITKNSFQLPVEPSNEFPFDAKVPLNKITAKEGQVILLSASFKLQEPSAKGLQACISLNGINKDTTYNYNSKAVEDFVIRPDSTVTIYTDDYCGTNYKQIKDKAKCTAFIWNYGKQKCVLTGFDIKTIDFWPQKWNFWY